MSLIEPKIICIMPCYNAEKTLAKAIESVTKQNYTNWELIIVDDASTDKSPHIAKKYLKDSRVTLLQNKINKGCYYSRNRALYHVKDKEWDLFTTHDADDTSTPDRFQLYLSLYLKNPNVNIVRGVYQGKRWKRDKTHKFIKFKKSYSAGVTWFNRSVFDTFGYFDNTRFSGDKEHIDRIKYYLQICFSKEEWKKEWSKILLQPDLALSYCYTTGLGNLSISNTPQTKQNYIKSYQQKFESFTSLDDFYYHFTPELEDL